MTMIDKTAADEKVHAGWLRAWFAFEVLAATEDIARASLTELVDKLEKDERAEIYRKEFGNIAKREKAFKGVEVAWSYTVELELAVKNFDELVQLVIEYGPSAIELFEPAKLSIPVGEAQAILNTISSVMHRFAAAGLGGIVFVRGKEQ